MSSASSMTASSGDETLKRLLRHAAMSRAPLEEKLDGALRILLEEGRPRKSRGAAVFRADADGRLRLAAQYGFSAEFSRRCAVVNCGQCLCGRVAENRKPLFSATIDERHDIRYPGMQDHGNGVFPLVADGRLLGVLNVLADSGTEFLPAEKSALAAVADIFALILQQHRDRDRYTQVRQCCDTAFRSSSDATVFIDRKGAIAQANRAAAQLFGHPARALQGRDIGEFLKPLEEPLLPAGADGTRRILAMLCTPADRRVRVRARLDPDILPALHQVQLLPVNHPVQSQVPATRYLRAFELLANTARCAIAGDDERVFVQRLVRMIARQGGYQAAWVGYAGDPPAAVPTAGVGAGAAGGNGHELRPAARFGFVDDENLLQLLAVGAAPDGNPLAAAMTDGLRHVIEDTAAEESREPLPRLLKRLGTRSLCILPLVHDGRALGVLALHATAPGTFRSTELDLLEHIARLLAAAINCRRTMGERDLLAAAAEQTPESVFITSREGVILYANPAFEERTGYSRREALGRKPAFLKSGLMSSEFYRDLWSTILRGDSFHGIFANRHKSGAIIYEEKFIAPLRNKAGKISYFISTGRDITERKRLEDQLKKLAYKDPLTGLPNRRLFLERTTQAIRHAQRSDSPVALILADLNDFKKVNDSLGHAAGDELLVAIVERFRGAIREEDTLARLGGDEFAVLLTDAGGETPARVAQRLIDSLDRPVALGNHHVRANAAMGIARHPEDGQDTESLLRNADVAMYRAKRKRESAYAQYQADKDAYSHLRLGDETALRDALAAGVLRVHYQPILDLGTGRVTGAEALLRWRDGARGDISPAWFVALAEESQLICELDEYAIATVMRETRRIPLPHFDIAVNISPRSLLEDRLPSLITRTRSRYGDTGRIGVSLEITERTMAEPGLIAERLNELTAAGVKISVDDFGTGYSSLSYLGRYPLHELKIDQSFTQGIGRGNREEAIVTTIIDLAHNLGLKAVAEGVETEAQKAFLVHSGCDLAQGYLLARPMPIDQLCTWLGSHRTPED